MAYHFRRVCLCIPCLFIFRQATGGLNGIWRCGVLVMHLTSAKTVFRPAKTLSEAMRFQKHIDNACFCAIYATAAYAFRRIRAGAFQPLCRLIHCDGVMPNALRNWRLNVHSEPKPQSNATSAQAAPPFDRRAAALLMRTLDRYCCGVSPEKRLNERSSDEWLKKHISASCGTVKFSRKCALI